MIDRSKTSVLISDDSLICVNSIVMEISNGGGRQVMYNKIQ